ncbi:MAG: ATP-binding protein [Desulfurivibrionaceae bacterium]|jgi:anti-sigma regulatory factor (Ser/Thr protein kinase)
MTPTQEPPSVPPLLCREHSIRTADSGEIDRFVAEVYAMMEPALRTRHFVNPQFRITLALHEAVANAWRHGNKKNRNKAVTVRWRVNEYLVLEVMDEGRGFDFQATSDPRSDENVCKPCGRGIAIITYLADHVSWQDQGRHLTASFGRTPVHGEKH